MPSGIHYIDHDKVAATMAKGGSLVHDPGRIVLAQRRKAGPVQYHDLTNHVFIMVDGEATLVVGGTMVDPKRTSPTEMEAASIDGGETYHSEQGRCYYDSRKDAALVQGSADRYGCLLRCEH